MKQILTLSLILLAATTGSARPNADIVRTVYFSAVDANGVHVTDLTSADLTVKEGGKDRVIEAVKPATALMQLSILVDDAGTGGFAATVGHFIQATFRRAEYARTRRRAETRSARSSGWRTGCAGRCRGRPWTCPG